MTTKPYAIVCMFQEGFHLNKRHSQLVAALQQGYINSAIRIAVIHVILSRVAHCQYWYIMREREEGERKRGERERES